MFDAPNLDAMNVDDLRVAAASLQLLANYARLKATAMERRARGQVSEALAGEAQCERLYRMLPDAHRW